MPSLLVYYRKGTLQTQTLPNVFRGVDWCKDDNGLVLAGDGGRIIEVHGEKSVVVDSGTRQNLRAVSTNRQDGTTLVVGNSGTVIELYEDHMHKTINLSTMENLRAVSWRPGEKSALIAGNAGTLLSYSQSSVEGVAGARANLRRISWRPNGHGALVASNCFAEEFIPSPNLFVFNPESKSLSPANEGRADFIGVDWKTDGSAAIVVGYDIIWHNGYIGIFDGDRLSPVAFENRRVYPVAVAWNRSADNAVIATATTQPGMGQGMLYIWNRENLEPTFKSAEFFFSSVRWNRDGTEFAALASSATRTFNC